MSRYCVYRCDQMPPNRNVKCAGNGLLDAARDQCSSCHRPVWINPKHAVGRLVICWDCAK